MIRLRIATPKFFASGRPREVVESQAKRASLGVTELELVRRMATTIEGGCLCGGVRYRLHDRPKQGSDCHCEDCRRASAAPYVTWCSVPSKAVEVLSGELNRVSYADRLRSFASCCGALLLIEHALQVPAVEGLTAAYLRVDPSWDPIRNDPRFQKLAEEKTQ